MLYFRAVYSTIFIQSDLGFYFIEFHKKYCMKYLLLVSKCFIHFVSVQIAYQVALLCHFFLNIFCDKSLFFFSIKLYQNQYMKYSFENAVFISFLSKQLTMDTSILFFSTIFVIAKFWLLFHGITKELMYKIFIRERFVHFVSI